MMNAKLVIVGGDAKTKEVDLKLPATVGRGREASLTLPHPLVSRLHCELYESDGRLFVRDLGSLNGTFLNNERIDGEAELPVGELLTIGTVTFRAEYEEEAEWRPPEAGEKPGEAQPSDVAKQTVNETEKAPAENTIQMTSSGAAEGIATTEGSTPKAPAPEPVEDGIDDEDFEGFDDLDFDEIDELGEDEEYQDEVKQQEEGESTPVGHAQPVADNPKTVPEVNSLPAPAPPAPAAQAVPNPASPLPTQNSPAQVEPGAAPPAQAQADSPTNAEPLPNSSSPAPAQPSPPPTTPTAADVPSAKAIGPADESSEDDADTKNDDEDLDAFLKGLD